MFLKKFSSIFNKIFVIKLFDFLDCETVKFLLPNILFVNFTKKNNGNKKKPK